MMKKILIVGAGFSGTVIAAQLMRLPSTTPTQVYLINGNGRIARGMAYGTQSAHHVLNVPVGNMSAFIDDPDHFLRYAQEYDPTITSSSFVPRRLYGDYLENVLSEAELHMSECIELKRIYETVTRIDYSNDRCSGVATLGNGEVILADKIVLALGHFTANQSHLAANNFVHSRHYLKDPWDHARIDAIPARASVLLVGTGLTAIDVAMTLLSRNPDRSITAVSRRGLLPKAHRHSAEKPKGSGAETIWGNANTVRIHLRKFREYCDTLSKDGRDWREVFALLRPVTANIWRDYSSKERERFLRHLQPYWDTHRHRLAPLVAERFNIALQAGSVKTLAGRILGFDNDSPDDEVKINVRPRGSETPRTLVAQYVINCTGPCADPKLADNQMVQQLLLEGMIRNDKLGLGIDVTPDCAVVGRDGHESDCLFYIGPWLKADYWEATAVPDLRVIANHLARKIIR